MRRDSKRDRERKEEESHLKKYRYFLQSCIVVGLLRSFISFCHCVWGKWFCRTAVCYASKFLGWCAKETWLFKLDRYEMKPFFIFVLGSSTGSAKTLGCVVSFVFCEDLPVWGWSTPALDGTLYTGLDFTFVESFQTFIHCVYTYLNIKDNTVKALL